MSSIEVTPELSEVELQAAKAEGASADTAFKESFEQLVDLVSSVDALELIARVSADLALRRPERPEDAGAKMAHLYQVEQLQALALTKARSTAPISPQEASRATDAALELLHKNANSYIALPKLKYVRERMVNEREELLALIRRWTLAVRGVRHTHQTVEYSTAIAVEVGASFRGVFGCDAVEVVQSLWAAVNEYSNNFRAWLEAQAAWAQKKTGIGMIDAFVRRMSEAEAVSVRAQVLQHRYDRPTVRTMLEQLGASSLVECFTLDIQRLRGSIAADRWPAVVEILMSLSIRFGDLSDQPFEHLQLDNPVRTRPFVRLSGDRLFCGSPHTVIMGLAEIMESLYAKHAGLKRTAEKARADWLEQKLESLVREFLPSAEVYRGVSWNDGESAETDLVAVIDQTVLVFEAKSAKILPSARRGGLNGLKEALDDLVVAPSRQSLRFKDRLDNAAGALEFKVADGRTLRLDPDSLRDVVRVNVVQDAVGPLSSHWPQLKKAGLIPTDADVAPTISVFDLENVFETMTLEIERCHYLSRRAELERNCIYTADELDLLALYVDCQFNIGEDEFNGEHQKLYGLSLRLGSTAYWRSATESKSNGIQRTEQWQRLLDSLESRKPPGWTRFGYRLLNVDVAGQRRLSNLINKGFVSVERDPDKFFTSGLTVGSPRRWNTIAVAVGAPVDAVQFEQNVQHAVKSAFEQGNADSLLLLYNFVPPTGEPYDFVATFYRSRMGGTILRPR
jgi:hypothetical protein